jgi:hypothetical protein
MPRIQVQLYQLLDHPTTATQGLLQFAATTLDMERQKSHPINTVTGPKWLSPRPKSTNSFSHLQILRLTDANPWRWKQCHQFLKPELLFQLQIQWITYPTSYIPPALNPTITKRCSNTSTRKFTRLIHTIPESHPNWSLNQHSVTYVN